MSKPTETVRVIVDDEKTLGWCIVALVADELWFECTALGDGHWRITVEAGRNTDLMLLREVSRRKEMARRAARYTPLT